MFSNRAHTGKRRMEGGRTTKVSMALTIDKLIAMRATFSWSIRTANHLNTPTKPKLGLLSFRSWRRVRQPETQPTASLTLLGPRHRKQTVAEAIINPTGL